MSVISQAEAKELCYILAALNYDGQQTIVTPDSFSKPNFPLVYKILRWFAMIVTSLDGEQKPMRFLATELPSTADRLTLFIEITNYLSSELDARLDLVNLYRSDLSCCPELLKLARPIHQAAKLALNEQAKFASDVEWPLREINRRNEIIEEISTYFNSIRSTCLEENKGSLINPFEQVIQLTNSIEVMIFHEENVLSLERQQVIDRRLEVPDIEQVLRNAQSQLREKSLQLERANEELEKDLLRLDEKLGSKEVEIREAKSRLDELLIESPAYAKQYEKLCQDYGRVYEDYVSNYRNLQYLQWCLYSSDDDDSSDEDEDGGDGDVISTGGDSKFVLRKRVANDQLELDASAASKPSGDEESVRDRDPLETRGGEAGSSRELDSTVGPARLLESLLDATGASNPISASATLRAATEVEGLTVGAATGAATGGALDGAVCEPLGRKRLGELTMEDGRRYKGRAAAGLELDGLLGSEFSAGASGVSYDEEGEDEEEEDDDESPDEDDGELTIGAGGQY